MPGRYLRGALIQFKPAFLVPVPNVIVFQYNPETMSSSWTTPGVPHSAAGQAEGNVLSMGSDPSQEFSFTISMDASDIVADQNNAAGELASLYGIYPRLAALETLMFSADASAQGQNLASGAGSATCAAASALPGGAAVGGVQRQVPSSTVPAVLFVWGVGRILPVRVASLRVTEKLYDKYLVPTHADADIGLRVLTSSDIDSLDGGLVKGILQTAYTSMKNLRKTLATEKLADPLISMIPPF
jgi:hypothetical protein